MHIQGPPGAGEHINGIAFQHVMPQGDERGRAVINNERLASLDEFVYQNVKGALVDPPFTEQDERLNVKGFELREGFVNRIGVNAAQRFVARLEVLSEHACGETFANATFALE